MPYRQDDISLLLPTFRTSVEGVLRRVRAAGHRPCLFDTLRSVEEAARNAARGKGIAGSMHLYGAAADIICDEHGWDCAKHKCEFYRALAVAVAAEGLVHGKFFTRVDLPHMQGVRVAHQAEMRLLGTTPESAFARDVLVQRHLAKTTLKREVLRMINEKRPVDAFLVKAYQREQGLHVTGELARTTLVRLGLEDAPKKRWPHA